MFYLPSQLLLVQSYLTPLDVERQFAEFIRDSDKKWRKPVQIFCIDAYEVVPGLTRISDMTNSFF